MTWWGVVLIAWGAVLFCFLAVLKIGKRADEAMEQFQSKTGGEK